MAFLMDYNTSIFIEYNKNENYVGKEFIITQ